MPKKSATQIPTLMKIDAMFFCIYQWRMIFVCKKAVQCPRGDACTLWHAKVPRRTIVHKNATEKLYVMWFAQAKLPDSLLRLHIPGMVLFVYGQMQELRI